MPTPRAHGHMCTTSQMLLNIQSSRRAEPENRNRQSLIQFVGGNQSRRREQSSHIGGQSTVSSIVNPVSPRAITSAARNPRSRRSSNPVPDRGKSRRLFDPQSTLVECLPFSSTTITPCRPAIRSRRGDRLPTGDRGHRLWRGHALACSPRARRGGGWRRYHAIREVRLQAAAEAPAEVRRPVRPPPTTPPPPRL